MVKLFISQPMVDKSDNEIIEEREKAIDEAMKALDDDVTVVDSFFQGAPHEANPLWFLSRSIQLLSSADLVYFAEGWQNYRGCRIEHECAVQYGIPVIEA